MPRYILADSGHHRTSRCFIAPERSPGLAWALEVIDASGCVLSDDPAESHAGATLSAGRGFWSFDLATVKQVPLSDAVRLEIRLEAYNPLSLLASVYQSARPAALGPT